MAEGKRSGMGVARPPALRCEASAYKTAQAAGKAHTAAHEELMMTDEVVQVLPVVRAAEAPGMSEAVSIASILPADSLRLSGENPEHTSLLRERLPELPAILVNRRTMQVVDGMHRLSAARLQGADKIQVRFVDVSQHEAFVLSVRANIEHGLPLSLADREAAARRILQSYGSWSDRAIADVVGLSPSTVAAIRARSTGNSVQLNVRMGRDGRLRPMSALDGRLRACEILSARPETPLREVAAQAHISLGTAHDVRDRMRRGDSPVPERHRTGEGRVPSQSGRHPQPPRKHRGEQVTWPSIRPKLMRDPAVRYVSSGQRLLRWLDSHAVVAQSWEEVAEAIPSHWVDAMAGLAYTCGDQWYAFARALERRAKAMNAPEDPAACPPRAEDGAA